MRNKKPIPILTGVLALCLLTAIFLTVTGTTAEKTYTNPVLVDTVVIKRKQPDNFHGLLGIGDPAILRHDNTFYLYPTGDNQGYDVYISKDLVTWQKGPRVFTSEEPGVWAPDVFFHGPDQTFYLYYTVSGRIGVASAGRPDAIFRNIGTLVDGAIDAHMFRDEDGQLYLYYVTYPGFRIYVQPMASPIQKKGKAFMIIEATESWEQKQAVLTEAPWMLKHRGLYYLLYSASGADTQDYAIGYATAAHPLGPFTKFKGNPLIKKGSNIFGPGHCSVTTTHDGKLWMVYHQKKDDKRDWNRIICIDRLWFDAEGVLHGKATRGETLPAPKVKG